MTAMRVQTKNCTTRTTLIATRTHLIIEFNTRLEKMITSMITYAVVQSSDLLSLQMKAFVSLSRVAFMVINFANW